MHTVTESPQFAFATLARSLRRSQRITGKDLAKNLNRTVAYIYSVENGKAPPPVARVARVWAAHLNAGHEVFEQTAKESLAHWPKRKYTRVEAAGAIPVTLDTPSRELGNLPGGGRRCLPCNAQTQVTDSREMANGFIRRRRECPVCRVRYTTYEISSNALEQVFSEQLHVVDALHVAMTRINDLVAQFKRNASFAKVALADVDQIETTEAA